MNTATAVVGQTEELGNGKSLIRCSAAGIFESEDMGVAQEWADKLTGEVARVGRSGETPDKNACILMDLRNFKEYTDPAVLSILSDLMKKDEPYVYKTATFGGTVIHEMAQGILRRMTKRENMRNFKTEEEAVAWLKE